MKRTVGILFLPAEGDPHKLLGDEKSVAWRCGWRPPVAWNKRLGDGGIWEVGVFGRHPWTIPHALILFWEGEQVQAGTDQLMTCCYEATDGYYREMWGELYDPGRQGLQEVRLLAKYASGPDLLYDEDNAPIGGLGTTIEIKVEK